MKSVLKNSEITLLYHAPIFSLFLLNNNNSNFSNISLFLFIIITACQRSLDQFYIDTYYTKWVKTSWTNRTEWVRYTIFIKYDWIFLIFPYIFKPLRITINCNQTTFTMVLILDGESDNGAHVRRNFCYLICSRHLIRPRAFKIVRNKFWVTS